MKFFTTTKISENIHETPEGFLVCVGVAIARTGEMDYGAGETPIEPGPDGKVVVTRTEEEVFRPETIASFQGKPLTILHPEDFVSPKNWARLAKGVVQNVRRGEGDQATDLIADLLITEIQAIGLVKSGLREVSCGYEADYVQTERGRGYQKNIIGNHLALVDEGRAGSQYAINDRKGKGSKMKIGDKIKAIFAKAQDEALAVATADEFPPKKDDETKAKDEMGQGYDALMKAVTDLGTMISGMVKKDAAPTATTTPTPGEPAQVVAKDDEVSPGLEERLTKLETMVAKLLEAKATGDADEEEETDDAVEACDEEEEEGTMTGDGALDLASRVEILAPGFKPETKDVKRKALIAAFATADGKAAIEKFTGGRTFSPSKMGDEIIDAIFIGASESLKFSREGEIAGTKSGKFPSKDSQPKGAMTPEEVNKRNAEFYSKKTA